MRSQTRARSLRLIAFATAIAGVVVLLGLRSQVGQNGPVPTTQPVTVEYEYAAGQPSTWGVSIPPPEGHVAATVTAVELQGVTGLDVVGIQACDTTVGGCSLVNAPGWPPSGIATLQIEGLSIAPTGTGPVYQILIGVSRRADASIGSATAVKVTYAVGGTTYEVVEPWTLRIFAPGAMPAS